MVRRGTSELSAERILYEISVELEAGLDDLVPRMMQQMRDEIPKFDVVRHPELWGVLRDSCYGNCRVILAGLRSDRKPPEVGPGEAFAGARASANAGIPMTAMMQTYRVGQAVLLEAFLTACMERRHHGPELDVALVTGSRFLFAYIDEMISQIVEEYAREHERWTRSSLRRRVQIVRDVLSGLPVDGGDLGYAMDGRHLGLVAVGADAEEEIRRGASARGLRLLALSVGDGIVWAWISAPEQRAQPLMRLDELELADGVVAGVGDPASGIEGFRETHRQAQAAYRVAVLLGSCLVHYDDVAVEAMSLGDEMAARAFVQGELKALTAEDARMERLRGTLEVYLASSMNATAAAARLGIGDRTVAYRIHSAEELLGRPIAARSTEIACALRIHRLLARQHGSTA
ncbi:MAG TPA: helix-turn-helix domain-containing protein [Baekduia sp.]|uniref:PucR family transcriptional regulator n=1 Tax=Baekduia sp. TaxID=2600305 RepID=UPI002D7815E4|nr:helix-turn-helix domain-containing protein [Baekduia sp.]HET6507603.1 helix-turn-helix domain-containing protein [Baekduia sp.]